MLLLLNTSTVVLYAISDNILLPIYANIYIYFTTDFVLFYLLH